MQFNMGVAKLQWGASGTSKFQILRSATHGRQGWESVAKQAKAALLSAGCAVHDLEGGSQLQSRPRLPCSMVDAQLH